MLKFLVHLPGDLRETSLALGAMQFAVDRAPEQIDFSAIVDDPLSTQLVQSAGHVRYIPRDKGMIGNDLSIVAAKLSGVHAAFKLQPDLNDSKKYGEEEARRIIADLISIDPSASPPDIKGLMLPYGYCAALIIRDALQEFGYNWDFHQKVDNFEIKPYATTRKSIIKMAEQMIKKDILLEDEQPVGTNLFMITNMLDFKDDIITQLYDGANPQTIYPLFLEDWKINNVPITLDLLIGLLKHKSCVATISSAESFLGYLAAACDLQHIMVVSNTNLWPTFSLAATSYLINEASMGSAVLPQLGIILADMSTKQDKLLIHK